MAHFYETIYSKGINPVNEETKLNRMLFEEEHYDGGFFSLGGYLNDKFFRKTRLSANYLDLPLFISDAKKGAKNDRQRFVFYCESLLSLFQQVAPFLRSQQHVEMREAIAEIEKVIAYDLDKMALTKNQIESDQLGVLIIIIPKDEVLENVLLNTKEKDVKEYLIEYKSSHYDGNVKAKEEILKLLANHVEGITKDKQLASLNKRIFDDADFLFNNLNIRHNQQVKDDRFYNATLNDREEWLDLAYREVLLVLSARIERSDHESIEKKKSNAGLK